LLLAVPLICLLSAGTILAFENRPYQDLLSHYTTSLTERSPAQRQNIKNAAQRLNLAVVAPGEEFSFNAVVGPRTIERGFAEANAFMEGERTRSLGGGICQVSSTLYAALQETTLPILKRVPHFAVVHSVPPGRDAAVWYGQADLVFKNSFNRPIQVKATADDLALRVEVWGSERKGQQAALRFSHRYGRSGKNRVVRVYRRVDGRNSVLSQDVYREH
jgi:vancomycin resistance protein YoaR